VGNEDRTIGAENEGDADMAHGDEDSSAAYLISAPERAA
jgi:hypothetical protein